jgi:pimeloyl-ACP methyl ester carboxylesterase
MNPSRKEIVVAFGGTVATSLKDWQANLRWFIPYHDDQYTKLVKEVEPQFVAEFLRRKQAADGMWLDQAKIYSTGHSLGAGLAQEFAYALPINPDVPRVTKVFAFDPSPVTGYTSVDKSLRDANRQDLSIDRIYERREILAILRSMTNTIDPPRATAPVIRQLRYNLFPRGNWIKNHSISELACKLNEASGN